MTVRDFINRGDPVFVIVLRDTKKVISVEMNEGEADKLIEELGGHKKFYKEIRFLGKSIYH
jgi:hypothetical protein